MNAQIQTMLDFPSAPKLNAFGKLDPEKATEAAWSAPDAR
jgi:hypothetical protein